MSVLAITGGTGFVGQHLIRIATAAGHDVRALARRPQPDAEGVRWVAGSLEDGGALTTLCSGADAVIHVAGVVNAPNRAAFVQGNVAGTDAIIEAARNTGVRRFVHVSSLSAREPDLSDYGWSKARSEDRVRASGLDWAVVRPPAVYGPGDREMLELFRMAAKGVVLLPPRGRLSLIEATDLSRLLLVLGATSTRPESVYEPDDGVLTGWSHAAFARLLGEAVGRRVLPLSVPAAMLRLASRIEARARPGAAKLTADRVRYFCHPDWVVSHDRRPPASVWQPQVETRRGLAETAAWYRHQGWLQR